MLKLTPDSAWESILNYSETKERHNGMGRAGGLIDVVEAVITTYLYVDDFETFQVTKKQPVKSFSNHI